MRSPAPTILSLIVVLAHVTALAEAPVHSWSQRVGGANADVGRSIAVDGFGNVLLIGDFNGTINLGGQNMSSVVGPDMFAAMFSAAGVHQWSKRLGGSGTQSASSIAVNADGSMVLTGVFDGTLDFGGGASLSASSQDVFLARLDPTGAHMWSKRFGSTSSQEIGHAVTIDASGSILVTGQVMGAVDFGGGSLEPKGDKDMFLAKFDASGVHQWSQRFGGTDNDRCEGLAVAADGSGNVIVTGTCDGAVNFGGGIFPANNWFDLVIAKFDANGVHQWSKRFGDLGSLDEGRSVAVDEAGNVFVTGKFSHTMFLGDAFLVSYGGTYDVFLIKFNSGGTRQWSRHFGGAATDEGETISVDAQGNVLLGGQFGAINGGTINFGGEELTSADASDVFLAEFDTDGNHQWSTSFPGVSTQTARRAVHGPGGSIYTTGGFNAYVDFGGGYVFSSGLTDGFLLKHTKVLTPVNGTPASGVLSVSCRPNPFNPHTTISYTVPSRARVIVAIYDSSGAKVATLVDTMDHGAGAFEIAWNGRDALGAAVSSGVYFASIEHAGTRQSSKLVLLK